MSGAKVIMMEGLCYGLMIGVMEKLRVSFMLRLIDIFGFIMNELV